MAKLKLGYHFFGPLCIYCCVLTAGTYIINQMRMHCIVRANFLYRVRWPNYTSSTWRFLIACTVYVSKIMRIGWE